LVRKTGTTHGNLSTHLSKLENAGYIRQEKGYSGKRPQTLVYLTDEGRTAWVQYLDAMKELLQTS
jgi:DNA-binding MarR family transcriptional regulator